MTRIVRAVAAGMPHHITQRGNRRQQTFFYKDDYIAYMDLMAELCGRHAVEIWAYCLMPNHIHLIAVPSTPESLGLAIGEAHRRYSRRINFREGWRGHLWQDRFSSFVMDQRYLLACARYPGYFMKFFEKHYFVLLFHLLILHLAVISKLQIVILDLRNKGNFISKKFTLRASHLERICCVGRHSR